MTAKGGEAKVEIRLKNIGDHDAEVILNEVNKSFGLYLIPNAESAQNYYLNLTNGSNYFDRANATVSYLDKEFIAFSEDFTINYTIKKTSQKTNNTEEEKNESNPSNTTETKTNVKPKINSNMKGFLSKSAVFIKKILWWRRTPLNETINVTNSTK